MQFLFIFGWRFFLDWLHRWISDPTVQSRRESRFLSRTIRSNLPRKNNVRSGGRSRCFTFGDDWIAGLWSLERSERCVPLTSNGCDLHCTRCPSDISLRCRPRHLRSLWRISFSLFPRVFVICQCGKRWTRHYAEQPPTDWRSARHVWHIVRFDHAWSSIEFEWRNSSTDGPVSNHSRDNGWISKRDSARTSPTARRRAVEWANVYCFPRRCVYEWM